MKKKILAGIILGAAVIGIAGCGTAGVETVTTTTAEETVTTTETETTTETTEETATQTTSETTTTEAEDKKEDTTEAAATTTAADSSDLSDSSKYGEKATNILVNKAAEGFSKVSDFEYESASGLYTYSFLGDATRHTIEAKLDSEAGVLTDAETGIKGDIMYVKGKTDNGYSITAYRNVGTGDSVSAYAGIEYLSEDEVSIDTVAALLSDDYIYVNKVVIPLTN